MTEMTRTERTDLAKLTRQRERLAKAAADVRKAELLADVEEQLSRIYSAREEQWAEATAAARVAIDEADAHIARVCAERGIPDEMRPKLTVLFSGRGEHSDPRRRAELRKLAQARIEVVTREAKQRIEAASVEVQTELLAGGLTTDAARAFLSSIPTAEALMPKLDVTALPGPGDRR